MAAKEEWVDGPVKYGSKKECKVLYGNFVPLDEIPVEIPLKISVPAHPYGQIRIQNDDMFVCHSTDLDYLRKIIGEGFRGGSYYPYTVEGDSCEMHFSWWSLCIPDQYLQKLQSLYKEKNKLKSHDFRSPVIKTNESRYGNYSIKLKLQQLVGIYKNTMSCEDVEFRVFSTSRYTREVMYTVAVIPAGETSDPNIELLRKHPVLSEDQVLFKKEGDVWLWNMQSVSSESYACWDHVTFAFYLSRGDTKMIVGQESILSNLKVVDFYAPGGSKCHKQEACQKLKDEVNFFEKEFQILSRIQTVTITDDMQDLAI